MSREIDLVGTGSTDAREWANEFNKVLSKRQIALFSTEEGKTIVNEEFLTAWFANVIEVAKDSVKLKSEPCPGDCNIGLPCQTCGSNGQYIGEIEHE